MSLALYWNGRAYYSPALLQWAPTRTFHDPNPPINLEDPPPSGGSGDAPTSTVTTGAGSTRSLTTGANNAPTSVVGAGAGLTRSLTTGANNASTATATTGAGSTSGLENPNAALIAQARILLARNLSALRRRWILRLLTRLGV